MRFGHNSAWCLLCDEGAASRAANTFRWQHAGSGDDHFRSTESIGSERHEIEDYLSLCIPLRQGILFYNYCCIVMLVRVYGRDEATLKAVCSAVAIGTATPSMGPHQPRDWVMAFLAEQRQEVACACHMLCHCYNAP
jgi:hypothetical protein